MVNKLRKIFLLFTAAFLLAAVFFCFKFKVELRADFAKALSVAGLFSTTELSPSPSPTDFDVSDDLPPVEAVSLLVPSASAEASADKRNDGGVDGPKQMTLEEIQEQIDYIQEQIDVLRARTEAGQTAQQPVNPLTPLPSPSPSSSPSPTPTLEIALSVAPLPTRNGGGGGGSVSYPKILISEVQILPIEQRFIELYNPNSTDVDLSDWYLQRKTKTANSWSSLVSSIHFDGKIIGGRGYFLIARQNLNADILTDDLTLSNDNSLALKNPNREISDKLGWGSAIDPELLPAQNPESQQSIGRKWANNDEEETDNNSFDFEIQVPTPKRQNLTYVEPTPTPSPTPQNGGDAAIAGPTPTPTPTSAPTPVPLKNILITEIQIEGANSKDEFVEIYNPNNFFVDLAGYALKKKTSGGNESNLVSAGSFSGTISGLNYFLIAPPPIDENTPTYNGSAIPDLYYSGKSSSFFIAKDNTVLLYNKNGILLDKVGFGLAKDFEGVATLNPGAGKSVQRNWDTILQTYVDTDNNLADFKAQNPTPKMQNISLTPTPTLTPTPAPTPEPTPSSEPTIEPSPAGSSDLF